MAYWVYILYSQKDKKLYVGCTSNLEKRWQRHKKGSVQATRNRRPLDLIHHEEYQDKAEAFNRERFLKSLWGGKVKQQILKKYFKHVSPEIFGSAENL